MNKQKFWLLFIIIALIIIFIFLVILNLNNIQKQISIYYYNQAEEAVTELDNDKSTELLLKAIKYDTEINSPELEHYHNFRDEVLMDPDNKAQYFKNKNIE